VESHNRVPILGGRSQVVRMNVASACRFSSSPVFRKQSRAINFASRFLTTAFPCTSSHDLRSISVSSSASLLVKKDQVQRSRDCNCD
jgi:hypothetical protein